MIERRLWFVGCSCGCTPSEGVTIIAETEEDAAKAEAQWAKDYAVLGSDSFRKVNGLSAEGHRLAVWAFEKMNEQDTCKQKAARVEADILRIEQEAAVLGIEVPKEKQAEVELMRAEAAALYAKAARIRIEIAEALSNNAEVSGDDYDDDYTEDWADQS